MVREILSVTLDEESKEYKTEAVIDGVDELNIIGMLCQSFRNRMKTKVGIIEGEKLIKKAVNGKVFCWLSQGEIGYK